MKYLTETRSHSVARILTAEWSNDRMNADYFALTSKEEAELFQFMKRIGYRQGQSSKNQGIGSLRAFWYHLQNIARRNAKAA